MHQYKNWILFDSKFKKRKQANLTGQSLNSYIPACSLPFRDSLVGKKYFELPNSMSIEEV